MLGDFSNDVRVTVDIALSDKAWCLDRNYSLNLEASFLE